MFKKEDVSGHDSDGYARLKYLSNAYNAYHEMIQEAARR